MYKRPKPFLPRWACYATLFTAVIGTGGGVANCFKAGPLAWNGLIAFWLPVLVFRIWARGVI